MVPVIEAACPAALMAGLGRPHRAPPPEPATAGRAVRVPAVTGGTDREEAIALPTGLLTEGLVHGGDARRTTADWTSCPNRGTTRTTGSVCRRARRSRGPGGPSGPSSSLPLRYPKQPGSGHNGGYGRRRPRGRKQPRPPGLAKPRRPRFHTAPTAVIYSGKQEPRTARDPAGASTIVQICALSSERQHCHRGQRHGPHTYLTFRTPEGRSSALYVPAAELERFQQGVAAWDQVWAVATQLAQLNREQIVRARRARARRGRDARPA